MCYRDLMAKICTKIQISTLHIPEFKRSGVRVFLHIVPQTVGCVWLFFTVTLKLSLPSQAFAWAAEEFQLVNRGIVSTSYRILYSGIDSAHIRVCRAILNGHPVTPRRAITYSGLCSTTVEVFTVHFHIVHCSKNP